MVLRVPAGLLTDEPIFWTDLLAKGGHAEVGVLKEQSLVGETYLKNFRDACRRKGIRIVAEATIAQTAQDVSAAVRALYEAKAPAIVHCGFGFGIVFINPALQELNWDPPRFTSTAFQNAWINPVMWNAFWAGPVSTSMTRAIRSARPSSTTTSGLTAAAPSGACRWSTATSQ